jgi:molybdenum cofactor cytidylyltransferase
MISRDRTIGIILLAAGASQRMGSPKQLLSFAGRSLIRHMGDIISDSNCNPKIVVLGANHTLIKPALINLPLQIQINSDWALGMSTSLRCGISALPDSVTAIVILLCDQPFVSVALIHQLIQRYEQTQASIVACEYSGTAGVPALFDRSLFSELQHLTGDQGARRLIQANRDRTLTIPFPQGSIDLDTIEDWTTFLQTHRSTCL